jgi:stage V sporulation protein G
MEDSEDRLRAFCSITFNQAFVVRDLKIIEGTNGPFVAMPSRKMTARCGRCGSKNHMRSNYCNQCGKKQPETPVPRDAEGRPRLYADIAHPINATAREAIQQRIVTEYEAELERAKAPGYTSRYDEIGDEDHRPPRPSA